MAIFETISAPALAATIAACSGLVGLMVALLVPRFQRFLASNQRVRRLLIPWLFILCYLILALGHQGFSLDGVAIIATYIAVPWFLLRPGIPAFSWPMFISLFWVWAGVEFGVLQNALSMPGFPEARVLAVPFAVSFAASLILGVVGLEGVKYRLTFTKDDLKTTITWLAIALAVLIPLGLATGFISWQGACKSAPQILTSILIVILLVAIPEEFFFRGLLQNILQKRWQQGPRALLTASVFFGVTHLNNGDHPDWRYGVLATLAGLAYGKAFTAGTSFVPAVIIHAAVDVIWISCFRP